MDPTRKRKILTNLLNRNYITQNEYNELFKSFYSTSIENREITVQELSTGTLINFDEDFFIVITRYPEIEKWHFEVKLNDPKYSNNGKILPDVKFTIIDEFDGR